MIIESFHMSQSKSHFMHLVLHSCVAHSITGGATNGCSTETTRTATLFVRPEEATISRKLKSGTKRRGLPHLVGGAIPGLDLEHVRIRRLSFERGTTNARVGPMTVRVPTIPVAPLRSRTAKPQDHADRSCIRRITTSPCDDSTYSKIPINSFCGGLPDSAPVRPVSDGPELKERAMAVHRHRRRASIQ